MKIVIKTKNVKLNRALEDFIQKKFDDLEKFAQVFQQPQTYFDGYFGKGKPRVEAWIEIGKESLHHQKGRVFRAECQMRFPGPLGLPGRSVRSEACSKYLRQAVTEVKDELQRQIRLYKNKLVAQTRRRQRETKKILRLAPSARFKKRKGARIREEGI